MFEFEGDGWSVGWNAGIMWRPHAKHSFGVMYRGQTDIEFQGTANTVVPGLVNSRETASAGIKFPQNVVAGYSFWPTEKWNFEVNIDWTDWDNLNTVNLRKQSGDVALPFNWRSSLFYEFGASYKFDNGVTASAGYIFSENSVPTESFNPLVPDSNRHIFSAGIGIVRPGGFVSGSFSMMKPVIPVCAGTAVGSVLTSSMQIAERQPFVTHIFWPLMRKSSPSRTAVVRMAWTSEPACGSVIENAERISAEASRGRNLSFCSVVPCIRIM